MFKRLICDIILLGSLFFLPWYWTASLAIIFMIFFRRYWEAAAAAFLIDIFYSVPTKNIYGHFGLFTAIGIILLIVLEKFKSNIRIN